MNYVNFKNEGGCLTVFLKGRIDSTNAPAIDQEIESVRTTNRHATIVIDVDSLEYISSAGLRIILRLLKEEPSLKVVNASTEVYEIFDMTGFTEMVKVEKGYRRISVEGCEIIGQGANGVVYRTDPDTIVKAYKYPDCLPDIQRERALARRAFVLGVPTAIPFDIVRIGDSYGSVFELLNADSLAKLIIKEPENIDKYITIYVNLLKKIHSTVVSPDDMPNEKDVVLGWVNFMRDYLPEEKTRKLFSLVDAVPNDNHMLHGDYHIKNIMMQNGEALLIDMDTLCHGNPIFEFSGIFNAYLGFSAYDRKNIEGFLGITYEQGEHIWRKTISLYFNTEDENRIQEITDRASLLGYIRVFRYLVTRHLDGTPDGKAQKKLIMGYILKLIDKVNSLTDR